MVKDGMKDVNKEDPRKKALGLRIKAFRKAIGLSQSKLGERMGRSAEAVSQLERGKYLPNFDTMIKLSVGLKVSLDDLFNLSGSQAMPKEKAQQLVELQVAAQSLSPKALKLAVSQIKAIQESDEN